MRSKVDRIVVKRLSPHPSGDVWNAKALRASGKEIDSSTREGRANAVASLLRFVPGDWKPSDFVEIEISPREYHYLPVRR